MTPLRAETTGKRSTAERKPMPRLNTTAHGYIASPRLKRNCRLYEARFYHANSIYPRE